MAKHDDAATSEFRSANPQPESVPAIIKAFEENIATVQSILQSSTDEQMQSMWRMKADGHVLMAMPRSALIRAVLLNHIYHHRGQMGVYSEDGRRKSAFQLRSKRDEMPDFM